MICEEDDFQEAIVDMLKKNPRLLSDIKNKRKKGRIVQKIVKEMS